MAERRRRDIGSWGRDAIALAIGGAIAVGGFTAYSLLAPAGRPATPTLRPVAPRVAPTPAMPTPAAATSQTVPRPTPSATAAEVLTVKRILPLDGPIKYGEWHWDDADVPAGPLVVTVDLDAETISVFRDGYEIGAAAVLYGADEKPTPLGVYPITQKDRDHKSTTYGGAPMPYMLRMTGDGVSIHGSKVEWGAATHGCIGVPIPFARKLFAVAKLGDRVIVTRGKRLGIGGEIAPST